MADSPQGDPSDNSVSKQSKRLQLRRTGFRGPVLTERNITPGGNDLATTRSRSRTSSMNSPNRDLQPLHALISEADFHHEPLRRPSGALGILQQVSNSTQRRKRSAARPRIDDVSVFEDENDSPSKIISDSPSDLPFIMYVPRPTVCTDDVLTTAENHQSMAASPVVPANSSFAPSVLSTDACLRSQMRLPNTSSTSSPS